MSRRIIGIIGLFSILTILNSCDKNRVYDQVYSIPSKGWNKDSLLTFSFTVADTTRPYDILLHVRNNNKYQYSNLWLFIVTKSPTGNTLRDTVEIALADDAGKWLGKGLGDVNAMLVPFMKNILFPYKGIYKIFIQQAMRQTYLKNILDVGVRLQYHEKLKKQRVKR